MRDAVVSRGYNILGFCNRCACCEGEPLPTETPFDYLLLELVDDPESHLPADDHAKVVADLTGYELDRVAGRCASLHDERSKPRTVFALAHPKPVNLLALVQYYPFLAALVDAEYGTGMSH